VGAYNARLETPTLVQGHPSLMIRNSCSIHAPITATAVAVYSTMVALGWRMINDQRIEGVLTGLVVVVGLVRIVVDEILSGRVTVLPAVCRR
jgi:hypothetical protein